MKVRPVNELATNPTSIPVSGIGGFTQALGYAIINVRIEGIGSYNEEQVVLMIEDVSGLGMRVPVILGTPTIHRLCRQLKESEFEMVSNEWQHALRCYEVAQQVPLNSISVEPDGTKYPTNTRQNPMDLDEQLILTDKVIIPTFSSQIIKVRTKKTSLKAKRLLMEFHHVFSLEPNEMGCTNTAEHTIKLLTREDEPFKERFRRIAPHEVEEVRQHIQEMLDRGAIRPSQSPWCNAVVLVRKKDGALRFCIDFRCLNAKTKKDSHPLPCGPETMESLVGARYFSTVDLKSGFWQIKMAEESCQYTAFTVGSLGIYEFLRMPYGLCNAPATFQHLMQNCLGELNLQYALIYLDDVIVYSRTPEDHLKQLQAVLDRFALNGLKLKPSKCHFFKESLTYLGHEISAAGMLPGQEGIQKIAEMGYPKTVTSVQKFIGATGYFR